MSTKCSPTAPFNSSAALWAASSPSARTTTSTWGKAATTPSPPRCTSPSSTPATWSAMEPAAPDVQRRSKLALTRLARHEDGDVTDGDARAGGDAFPRGQLDRAAVAGAGEPTDLGDPDH